MNEPENSTEMPMSNHQDLKGWSPRFYKGTPAGGALRSAFIKDELSSWQPRFCKASPDASAGSEGHDTVPPGSTPRPKFSTDQKSEPLGKPYASEAQRGKFHAMEDRGEISHATVKEWDEASKGKKLPEHVGKDEIRADLSKWEPRFAKAKVDEASPEQLRTGLRAARRWSPQDPMHAQREVTPGVSSMGIEARRGDARNKGVISHGYARTGSPEMHMQQAKAYGKDRLRRTKEQPAPQLPKSEIAKSQKYHAISDRDIHWHYSKLHPVARKRHHEILSGILGYHAFPASKKTAKKMRQGLKMTKSAMKEPGAKPVHASQVKKDKEKATSSRPVAKKPSSKGRN